MITHDDAATVGSLLAAAGVSTLLLERLVRAQWPAFRKRAHTFFMAGGLSLAVLCLVWLVVSFVYGDAVPGEYSTYSESNSYQVQRDLRWGLPVAAAVFFVFGAFGLSEPKGDQADK